ncbi:uncharacterized protein B0H18DRAFT_519213 [Fomitopsis serialis]|uniref:uncharacterized protein n=1 Tax=Fomitopsis serialis TaxID=139415 RepID=UPI0020080FAE|nr:uncharacterized protein B0H18DRAFT_519213 [Neoantrodia serialis]KAH9922433.1 hypothetical protein B0H18DRAFT_519213 [Neoantrodia serialis]
MDTPVPDYPPPSFQEAILSSPSVYTLPSSPYANSSYATSSYSATPQTSPPASPAADSLSFMRDVSPSRRSPLSPDPPSSAMSGPSDDPGSDSDDSSVELVTLEPEQHWEADRSTGFSLHQRVQREFVRQHAAESSTTVNLLRTPDTRTSHDTSASISSTHGTRPRRCSHCGSLRPAGDVQSGGDDDDSVGREGVGNRECSIRRRNREKMHRSLDLRVRDTSPPPSPASTVDAPAFSPWASTATLLSSAFSINKPAPASPGNNVKRKESVGLRKLFMKGKEKERGREKEEKTRDEYSEPRSPSSNDDLHSWEEITPSEAEGDGVPTSPASPKRDKLPWTPERPPQPLTTPVLAPPPRPARRNRHVSPYVLPPPSLSDIPFPPEKAPRATHPAPSPATSTPPAPTAHPASPVRPHPPSRLARETHLSSPTPLSSSSPIPRPRPPRDRSPLIGRFRRPDIDAPYPASRMSIEPAVSVTGSSDSSSGSSVTVPTVLRAGNDGPGFPSILDIRL